MALFKKKNEEVEEKNVVEKKKVSTSTQKSSLPVPATDYSSVLLRPRVTEKSTIAVEKSVYVFEVDPRAGKKEIAQAVQQIYNVIPRKINVVRIKPRKFFSRMRGQRGMRSGYKKAYVYLREGDSIEIV